MSNTVDSVKWETVKEWINETVNKLDQNVKGGQFKLEEGSAISYPLELI